MREAAKATTVYSGDTRGPNGGVTGGDVNISSQRGTGKEGVWGERQRMRLKRGERRDDVGVEAAGGRGVGLRGQGTKKVRDSNGGAGKG